MNAMTTNWRDDLDVWASPILANMLWILFSIPIITIPLAIAGLLGVMYHWMNDRNTQVFSIFFMTIRKTWYKCYLLALIDLIIGAFLVFNMLVILQMDMTEILPRISFGATLFTLAVFAIANVPAWVMVAVWDVPFKQIVSFAVQLVFLNTLWTVITGICFILPFAFAVVLPNAVFITVIGALAAALASRGTHYLMTTYLPPSQFNLIKVI